MSSFAYHFHAKPRDASKPQETHGIVTTSEPVIDTDRYLALCNGVAEFMGFASHEDIVMTSFTFLHEVA